MYIVYIIMQEYTTSHPIQSVHNNYTYDIIIVESCMASDVLYVSLVSPHHCTGQTGEKLWHCPYGHLLPGESGSCCIRDSY